MPQETWTLDQYRHYVATGKEPVRRPGNAPLADEDAVNLRSAGQRVQRLAKGRNLGHPDANQGYLPPGVSQGVLLPLRLRSEKNEHVHWTSKANRTKTQREYVYTVLSRLWEIEPLPLVITLTRIAPRALDDDNLQQACSGVRDGVSDWLAGWYGRGQDRQEGLKWCYAQKRVAPRFYAVEVKVERPKGT